jgi:hypothetical protein
MNMDPSVVVVSENRWLSILEKNESGSLSSVVFVVTNNLPPTFKWTKFEASTVL